MNLVDFEICRTTERGQNEMGLFGSFWADDDTTIKSLLYWAEYHAKEICEKRDEKFVWAKIRSIHEDYHGTIDPKNEPRGRDKL